MPEVDSRSSITSVEQGNSTRKMSQKNLKPVASSTAHPRPLLKDINSLLTCSICNGYFIDATTINACFHTCKYSSVIIFTHTHEPFLTNRHALCSNSLQIVHCQHTRTEWGRMSSLPGAIEQEQTIFVLERRHSHAEHGLQASPSNF